MFYFIIHSSCFNGNLMCDVSNCNRGKENKFHFDSDNNETYSIGIRKTSYFRFLTYNLPNHNY